MSEITEVDDDFPVEFVINNAPDQWTHYSNQKWPVCHYDFNGGFVYNHKSKQFFEIAGSIEDQEGVFYKREDIEAKAAENANDTQ